MQKDHTWTSTSFEQNLNIFYLPYGYLPIRPPWALRPGGQATTHANFLSAWSVRSRRSYWNTAFKGRVSTLAARFLISIVLFWLICEVLEEYFEILISVPQKLILQKPSSL